ncbi:SDR family NAD(P)-dependent oxidoreductase [Variovorax guangxiensis]|uniref:SDR family NAD(P)-dependent oxidoreductase n=1 Tax=Variovorax guangxiensis TaxID=1775474 RepID=UPI002865C382|nr:SDR family NAD(P)-dependent oxidoreductase [Variovorax guangxiensis]MDR6858775.1 3-oxoacyl-[acyl-carrier protein] reductase [Variovorax guangxiensis]
MNTWSMQSAVVPVTGAASGIGLAVCKRLRAEGATPLMLDVNAERLATAAGEVFGEACDSSRYTYAVDVRDSAAVDACFADILRAHGRATHAVAAAGIVDSSNVLTTTDEQWHRVIDVNLHGAMYFCRAAARQFAQAKRGSIVTVASIGGLKSKENRASYTASKAALINLTRSLAVDLGGLGIRANAVAPGVIDTPIQDGNRAGLDAVRQTIPLQRIGTADEIANGVLFLLSDLASYVTGETLVLDGGMTAKYR